jgi:exodeoxyribonuclease VII large subunit
VSDGVPGWTRSKEHAPRVLRVVELNREVRFLLEDRYPDVWVEGELADVSRPASGHLYFTLCDSDAPAQVRGVMYRKDAQRARAKMEDGARVRMRCSLTLYDARGTFQLVARVALPAGEGDRAAEVARIRARLAADGLLDPSKKRALPRLPRRIGVVTSRDGAAIHDIVRVAHGRMAVPILLAHCQVQGPDAPLSIVRALRAIARVPDVDVVIVARGGGASEDLSAFDDERVARAIAECPVPTVSGVGHEVDVTLADDVADVRAATPSNAAELVVPDGARLRDDLEALERALARGLDQRVQAQRLKIERLLRRMADPRRRIAAPRSALTQMSAHLQRMLARELTQGHRALDRLRSRLAVFEPRARLARDRDRLESLDARLRRAIAQRLVAARARHELAAAEIAGVASETTRSRREQLERSVARLDRSAAAIAGARRHELARLAGKLEALSPIGILARGYAIALHEGRAVVRASDVSPGDEIAIRVHEGTLRATVVSGEESER